MRKWAILIFLGVAILASPGWLAGSAQATRIDYTPWETVLKVYVDADGLVDYGKLKANRNVLDNFIQNEIENADLSALTKEAQKAFWINAYNALTVRLIIDHYPLRFGGIRTINWGRPWDIKMKAATRTLTLNQMEHDILRKWDPADARIHFAIVCASIGCPVLREEAYRAEGLDAQLDDQVVRFINTPSKFRYDTDEGILFLSPIMKWFKEDFDQNGGPVAFFKGYVPADIASKLQKDTPVSWLEYDWGLNDQK